MSKVFQTLEMREQLKSDPLNDSRLRVIFSAVLNSMEPPQENTDESYKEMYRRKEEVYHDALIHFKDTFKTNIFYDEYYIFWQILDQGGRATKYTKGDLEVILDHNMEEIMNAKYTYTFNEIKEGLRQNRPFSKDEAFILMKNSILELYEELSRQYVSKDDYLTACKMYIDSYKNFYTIETTMTMADGLSNQDGVDIVLFGKKTKLHDVETATAYFEERKTVLGELGIAEAETGFVYNAEYELARKESGEQPGILDYGIAVLDTGKAEIRRGNVINIMGPPKGGKTTFTTFEVVRALQRGLNVAVWPLEGTPEEWIALIKSIIATQILTEEVMSKNPAAIREKVIAEITTRGSDGKTAAPSKSDIMYNNLTDEQASLVETASTSLYNLGTYGKLSFVQATGYVENFDEILNNHYETQNPFDIIVIDSPVNMQSKSGRPKSEYLSQAFQKLKAYVTTKQPRPVVAYVTSQYKQTAINDMLKDTSQEIDITAGGETAETIRTPDDVIGLFSTPEERAQRFVTVYDIASRGNTHFKPFKMGCALGHGTFWNHESAKFEE